MQHVSDRDYQNNLKIHQMKRIAQNYNPGSQQIDSKLSGKKKSELMNVYFQNNSSIGELDTVDSHGLIMNVNGDRVARNESHLNKYN